MMDIHDPPQYHHHLQVPDWLTCLTDSSLGIRFQCYQRTHHQSTQQSTTNHTIPAALLGRVYFNDQIFPSCSFVRKCYTKWRTGLDIEHDTTQPRDC